MQSAGKSKRPLLERMMTLQEAVEPRNSIFLLCHDRSYPSLFRVPHLALTLV